MREFEIPGKPIAKKRAKYTSRGKFVQVYNPSRKDQGGVISVIHSEWRSSPIAGPVELHIVFHMPIPCSWSKRKQERSVGLPHITKPDKDNLDKFLFDCMSGIVYADDKQIWNGSSKKIYSTNPRTTVQVQEDDAPKWQSLQIHA